MPPDHPRPLWVFPNRHCTALAAVTLAMWYAGASQSNGAAYLLCFVLVSMILVSSLHCWTNLRGIELQAGTIQPVFEGEEIRVEMLAKTRRNRPNFGVWVKPAGGPAAGALQIPAAGEMSFELLATAPARGIYRTFDLHLESRYPLGFFTARQRVVLPHTYVVYPKPRGEHPLPVSLVPAVEAVDGQTAEGDDFSGVRSWREGESQRHIDWKAVARGQPLYTKQWAGNVGQTVWLEWDLLPGMGTEDRLGQLARWVLAAERSGVRYGLRVPGAEQPLGNGEVHQHRCLRALAGFSAS